MVVALLVALTVLMVPAPADAQPWADAFKAGDYERAAALLHPVVAEADIMTFTDQRPYEHLAEMYARGLGVQTDRLLACMLARVARQAFRWNPGQDVRVELAREDRSREFARVHCAPLADEERIAAERSFGCYAFGLNEQVLQLGDGVVTIARRGIAFAGSVHDDLLGCVHIVPGARARSLEPPPDAAPSIGARHFLEVFSWQVRKRLPEHQTIYVLEWALYETRADGVVEVARVPVASSPSWPNPMFPPDLDARLSLEMVRSGHVRWRVEGDPPARGWIMLPEGPR